MQDFCKLSTEEKEIISNSIITSLMNEVKEVYAENNLQHKNAYHMLTWDFIGSRIIEVLKKTRLNVKKVKRGRYSFDLIVDEQNATVYSIMKKSNIYRIKNGQNVSHYLWALASINDDIKVQEGQLSLFAMDTAQTYREETKKNLLSDVENIITRYCTIVINDDNKQFPSIELHVYDMNLNQVYEEKWKESLIVDYSFEFDANEEEKTTIPKVKFKENIDNDIIKIKDNKNINRIEKEG